MKKFAQGLVAAVVMVMVAGMAYATPAFNPTPPTFDLTLLSTMAEAILGGLATIWLLRKLIKSVNRS